MTPLPRLPLDCDALAYLVHTVSPDDRLALSLACRQLNQARTVVSPRLTTLARSTLRSEELRLWATGLGCPPPYPCWAVVQGPTKAPDLNGRVCRILGPPTDEGRYAVELDAGWGGCEALILPAKARSHVNPSDLAATAQKLVRQSNLRVVLRDDELVWATRVMCKGEAGRTDPTDDEKRGLLRAYSGTALLPIRKNAPPGPGNTP
jgi:hypothetical protein